jgi:prepilin-type N-terminal cleavage/methylation domain-containing protein
MIRKVKKSESGFTLAEMIIVMVIISVLSLTLANFVTTWLQQASLANTRSALLQTAETALDTATSDIRLSGSVDTTNRWPDTNGPGGNQFGWSSGSQTLILAKVAETSANKIIFSDPSEYITQKDDEIYYLSGTTLYRRTLASTSTGDAAVTTCPVAQATKTCPADTTIATGVASWAVSYYDENGDVTTPDNARSVQLAITISSKLDSQTISESYTTRMVFRND